MAAKPLDIWQTSSSTHWQCPPKRLLARCRLYDYFNPNERRCRGKLAEAFHFGIKKARREAVPYLRISSAYSAYSAVLIS